MKKVMVVFVLAFLLIGVLGFAHADGGENVNVNAGANAEIHGGSANGSGSANISSNDSHEGDQNKSMNQEKEQSQVSSEDKNQSHVEDNNQTETETETHYHFKSQDGQEYEIQIKTKTKNGQETESSQELNFHGYNVSSDLKIHFEDDGNESMLKVNLSDGEERAVKVLPDVASQRAIDVFNSKNVTVVLKQVGNGTNASVVYDARTNKTVAILGIFKANAEIQAQIDSETGNVLNVNKPWWYFLTFGSGNLQVPASETANASSNESVNVSTNASA